ncbi:hypothetical protein [Candidatus Lokiarchaeum ossiferum]|uniref:hypothetical protein n=1 Tax=Candidatus Lokiarchaeum ossiferum TaxID=2951803 RepID=UPI00352FCBBD
MDKKISSESLKYELRSIGWLIVKNIPKNVFHIQIHPNTPGDADVIIDLKNRETWELQMKSHEFLKKCTPFEALEAIEQLYRRYESDYKRSKLRYYNPKYFVIWEGILGDDRSNSINLNDLSYPTKDNERRNASQNRLKEYLLKKNQNNEKFSSHYIDKKSLEEFLFNLYFIGTHDKETMREDTIQKIGKTKFSEMIQIFEDNGKMEADEIQDIFYSNLLCNRIKRQIQNGEGSTKEMLDAIFEAYNRKQIKQNHFQEIIQTFIAFPSHLKEVIQWLTCGSNLLRIDRLMVKTYILMIGDYTMDPEIIESLLCSGYAYDVVEEVLINKIKQKKMTPEIINKLGQSISPYTDKFRYQEMNALNVLKLIIKNINITVEIKKELNQIRFKDPSKESEYIDLLKEANLNGNIPPSSARKDVNYLEVKANIKTIQLIDFSEEKKEKEEFNDELGRINKFKQTKTPLADSFYIDRITNQVRTWLRRIHGDFENFTDPEIKYLLGVDDINIVKGDIFLTEIITNLQNKDEIDKVVDRIESKISILLGFDKYILIIWGTNVSEHIKKDSMIIETKKISEVILTIH